MLFVTDAPGVTVEGEAQPSLATSDIDTLIGLGIATDGMAAKLRAAAAALQGGAKAVRIGDLDLLRNPAAGTRILAAAPQLA